MSAGTALFLGATWLAFAAGLGVALGRAMRMADEQEQVEQEPLFIPQEWLA